MKHILSIIFAVGAVAVVVVDVPDSFPKFLILIGCAGYLWFHERLDE